MSRPAGKPPARLVTAVDALEVNPQDRVLEIGCGRGVAAALVCARLTTGRLLAIDRSAKAIAAAKERSAEAIASGKATFLTAALEDTDPATLGHYDRILAVNVNLFWVRPAGHELGLITRLLRPGGHLLLCYDPPSAEHRTRLEATLRDHLGRAGYHATMSTHPVSGHHLLVVRAQPGARAR